MIQIDLPKRNNTTVRVINENGDIIVGRLHTFRGVTYLSMIVNGTMVSSSEPCIRDTDFGTMSTRLRYGSFIWLFPYKDEDYPYVDNFGTMCQLWYKQPSEF